MDCFRLPSYCRGLRSLHAVHRYHDKMTLALWCDEIQHNIIALLHKIKSSRYEPQHKELFPNSHPWLHTKQACAMATIVCIYYSAVWLFVYSNKVLIHRPVAWSNCRFRLLQAMTRIGILKQSSCWRLLPENTLPIWCSSHVNAYE